MPGFRPIVVNHSRKVGMTKPLALPAVLLVVPPLVVAGCGSSGKKSGNGTTTSATNTTSASGKKIGLVTDVGGLNDKGFNHLAYVGLQTANRKLGVQTKVNLSQSSSEYVPNMTSFVRQGYDFIIGVGFTEASAIDTAAHQFPSSKFAVVDVDQTSEP